jgi:hypothetical protein
MSSTLSASYIDDDLELMTGSALTLTPSQQRAADGLLSGMAAGQVCVLQSAAGMGKTTVLRWLRGKLGGALVTARDQIAERFLQMVRGVLQGREVALVDDVHRCKNFGQEMLGAVAGEVEALRGKLLFTLNRETKWNRAAKWEIEEFGVDDLACVCRLYLGSASERLNFEEIHRFAPALNAYQIKNACFWLGLRYSEPTTQSFIEHLGSAKVVARMRAD